MSAQRRQVSREDLREQFTWALRPARSPCSSAPRRNQSDSFAHVALPARPFDTSVEAK